MVTKLMVLKDKFLEMVFNGEMNFQLFVKFL